MSPGWSHSLSSFGFQASLLSNKVTFHNSTLPWNTRRPHKYTSTCICSALKSTKGGRGCLTGESYKNSKTGGGTSTTRLCVFSEVNTKKKKWTSSKLGKGEKTEDGTKGTLGFWEGLNDLTKTQDLINIISISLKQFNLNKSQHNFI